MTAPPSTDPTTTAARKGSAVDPDATTLLRDLDGAQVPVPGRWRVDPGHAEVAFIGRHLMFTKVRGRFTDIEAVVAIADRLEDSSVEATIAMASVDSGDATRDAHLRSADLFDVEAWPTATFRSTAVDVRGRAGTMAGVLTIKGVTRPVTLEVAFLGAVRDPWGGERAVFEAHGRLNREDWGLTWNMALETGGLLVSKEVDLELHLELLREG